MHTLVKRLLEWTCIATLAALLATLTLTEYGRRVGDARRHRCLSRMCNVCMALQAYATNHEGQLPPAYITDENGRPMHSWRVLILQYLGDDARALYDKYDFDEPWN